MLEVDCQGLMIDAVKSDGGMAHKMSHRFLVGVVDLLVKLPDLPMQIVEVKLHKAGAKLEGTSFGVTPDITVLQWEFLKKYAKAGASCSLASFIEYGGKGIRKLYLGVFPVAVNGRSGYVLGTTIWSTFHQPLTQARRYHEINMALKGER